MKRIRKENKKYLTTGAKETQKLGADFAKNILEMDFGFDGATIIALSGDLGGGKTTFLQGFAKGLGIKEKVLSPTFVVQKRFKLKNKKFKNFYHIDCYRLDSYKDAIELKIPDALKDAQNIIAVEWPEKIGDILNNKKGFLIKFEFVDEKTRKIGF
jgi:tRNA threonylcarbamoyladenosine biosynthesis protein TsaE